MGRVLALDYGTRRIGVALSDPLGIVARPFAVVAAGENAPGDIARIARENDVERIVVGLPVGLSGHEGPSAELARRLAAEVEEATGLPVDMIDERFTTRTAEEALVEGGVRRRERRTKVDKVAAAVILQQYLERTR